VRNTGLRPARGWVRDFAPARGGGSDANRSASRNGGVLFLMRLNTLIEEAGLRTSDVCVILHTSQLQPFRRLLRSIVSERPDLFDAYQSLHSDSAQKVLRKRKHCVSFVPYDDGRMVFAGAFQISGFKDLPVAQVYNDPRLDELSANYGAVDTDPKRNIANGGSRTKFKLEPFEKMEEYVGRILIKTPNGRTYVRLAENLNAYVLAMFEQNQLSPPVPNWREFIVTAQEVRALPSDWAASLREWRGIYLIVDQSDGERYVGSAYGDENLWGRWRAHVSGDRGVTVELQKRDPNDFRFSILERVSPDMTINDIVPIENNWKARLDTTANGLNLT